MPDRFMITQFSTGLQENMPAWQLPEDAFTQLNNAYVFRGRVRKRFGAMLMNSPAGNPATQYLKSRFRINIGTTDGAGEINVTLNPPTYELNFFIGQGFSIGNNYFTVNVLGTPANLLRTTPVTSATFDTTTGELTIIGTTANTAVYFYPSLPVMGLTQFQIGPVNNQPTYGFDTDYAYQYITSGWERLGVATWNGTNLDYFWSMTYRASTSNLSLLFTTNFNVTKNAPPLGTDDPILYWDGSTWAGFAPYFAPTGAPNTGPRLVGARIIVQFQNRLLFLNTVEFDGTNNNNFKNRIRFSAPRISPLETNAFYIPNSTDGTLSYRGGNSIDASTQEEIISVGFVKNRLIVYFEQSTYEVAFTSNPMQPFLFQKINAELGSQSTFSSVSFDRELLAIGNTGVHACNGANVYRIDQKIPNRVFKIDDKENGIKRIQGIRDFYNELVYWTFPSLVTDNNITDFCNRILLYNYANKSWAFNDDTIMCFGYFQQTTGFTWQDVGEVTWQEANFTWTAGLQQARFRSIIAGNQQGFVFVLNQDLERNAPALYIDNVTIVNPIVTRLRIHQHNFVNGEIIAIEYSNGIDNLNDNFVVFGVTENTVDITPYNLKPFSGTYTGGGLVTRISRIEIQTKQMNPYVDKDINVAVPKIDVGVQRTPLGVVSVDYFVSSADLSLATGATASESAWGTSVLETHAFPSIPFESQQRLLWHTFYPQAQGSNVMFKFYLSNPQMLNRDTAWSGFDMEGLVVYTSKTGNPLT